MTIFKQIIEKKIPANIVYEDELSMAFRDVNPQAPVHILVVPKKEIAMLQDVKEEDKHILGHLLYVATLVAKQEGLETGYRVVINNGPDACQTVPHIHLHILGGRGFAWPPG